MFYISVIFLDLKNKGAAILHVLKQHKTHRLVMLHNYCVLNLCEIAQNVLFKGEHVDLFQDVLVSWSLVLCAVTVELLRLWLGMGEHADSHLQWFSCPTLLHLCRPCAWSRL